jgi:hypothetical protein
MSSSWTPHDLQRVNASDELVIAVRRADGTLRSGVPIWVVCVDQHVYVRTWYRRPNGWFGHALRSRRAHIQVSDLRADVTIADLGEGTTELRGAIDNAYRTKYASNGSSTIVQMVSDTAAATTLRLEPE